MDIPYDLLTRTDAAKAFRISVRTLDDWTKRGIIKHIRIGGIIRYKPQFFEEVIDKHVVRGARR